MALVEVQPGVWELRGSTGKALARGSKDQMLKEREEMRVRREAFEKNRLQHKPK